jgi:D-lactate dehydrogenase
MAKGFGMKVLISDLNQNSLIKDLIDFKYTDLDTLLKKSDVVSLHLPYNKATHHIINKENIKLLKKGSILINTARGGLVDIEALKYALDKKIIAGAGLDVLECEEYVKENANLEEHLDKELLKKITIDYNIIDRENVIITWHNAFNSKEAIQRILDTTINNISAYENNKLQNLVN